MMRAMRAEPFTGYGALKLVEVPKPILADGALTGQALATLGLQGVLTSLGYSAGRQTTIDVTDLIWKRARMSGFLLFAQSHAVKAAAWATILSLLTSGRVKPMVERTYKLEEAAEALRHLIEDRPFGRAVVAG